MSRNWLIYLCLGLVLPWLAAACGSELRRQPALAGAAAAGPPPEIQLPQPSALHAGSFAPLDLLAWGNEFEALLPHNNVTAFAQQASFYPHSNTPGDALSKAAYAVYAFQIADYTFDNTLHFDLTQTSNFDSAWVALADFKHDRWEWFHLPAGGVISFDRSRHFSASDAMYVVPLFTGNQEWYLRAIRVGTVTAPQIISVAPQSGVAGSQVTLTATLSGTPPYDYSWTNMTFATPTQSTAIAPSVTLGLPGQYSYALRVVNSAGETGHVLQTFTVLPVDTSWQHSWGGVGNDKARDVVVDATGNVFVVGESASVDAHGAAVIMRYSPTGELQWVRGWDGPGGEAFDALAIDQDGNLLAAGWTYSFGEGLDDLLLVKYAPDGTLLSQRTWGGAGRDSATGLAVDSAGNVYVCGKSDSFAAYGHYGVLLLKFNSAGVFQWAWLWGGEQPDEAEDVVLDSLGNAYVAGVSETFGGVGFMLKSDPSGALTIQATWDYLHAGDKHFYGLAVDAADYIYVIGDMPDGDVADDPVLIKYNSDLQSQWTRQWRGAAQDTGRGITVDSSGVVYATGTTWSRGPSDSANLYLMVLDSGGGLRRVNAWGLAQNDDRGAWKLQEGRALALMPDGDPLLVGSCENMFAVWEDAGSGLLDATGFEYNVAGSVTLSADIHGVEGVALGASDSLLTGYTQDTGYATQDFAVLKANP